MPRTHRPSACHRSVFSTLSLIFLLAAALLPAGASASPDRARAGAELPAPPAAGHDPRKARESYGRVPMHFEANRGQVDRRVKFLSRGHGYTLFLTSTEAVLALRGAEGGETRGSVLRMSLRGADPSAPVAGEGELPGRSNYLVGRDAARWRGGVPAYERVTYRGVYPGVDLVYYGNQRQLEYDFRLAPGADPSRIRLSFRGADRVELEAGGDLLLHTAGGVVRQHRPFLYQEVGGARREVAGRYVGRGPREVGFEVGPYDRSLPLVIDPVLVYSTYLGATGMTEEVNDIAVDAAGHAYVVGTVAAADFPTTAGALQTAPRSDSSEAFVAKLSPEGNALVYSTYLGGSRGETAHGVALDAAGHAHVVGSTGSPDFPTTAGAPQAVHGGGASDGFVVKLNPEGSALAYSTLFGGGGGETGHIALDSAGFAYVGGTTTSADFPTTAGAHDRTLGTEGAASDGGDAFLLKLNQAGTALAYSTLVGGARPDAAGGVAVDPAGNAYIAGTTSAGTDINSNVLPNDFPTTPGAFQRHYASAEVAASDAFVAKLNADGTALLYSTYLGGKWEDWASGLAVDAAGHAYVTGTTDSTDFPARNAFQPALANVERIDDAFVTKLTPDGTALVYSTFLGGGASDSGVDLALDAAGQVYVTGTTNSDFFPVRNALQGQLSNTYEPSTDAFVTRLNPEGTLDYSTFYGGLATEQAAAIAVGPGGDAFFTGRTAMRRLTRAEPIPLVNPFQSERRGASDDYIARLRVGEDEPTYTIRGRVTTPDGRGLADAQINVRGSAVMRRTTDAEGFYTVEGLRAGGSYMVNSYRMFFTSAPTQHTFNHLAADQTADFVATPQQFHISGRVTDASGANAVAGVTVELGGGRAATTQTDASGNYTFQGLTGGQDYTVTATSPQYTYNPPTRTYVFLNQDQHFASFYATPVAPAPTPTPTPAPTPAPAPTPVLVNHALAANGATAAASSTMDANRAALAAINGDRRGQNWGSNPSTGSGWHDATSNSYPDWLEVSFNGAKSVQRVNLFSVQDNVSAPQEPTEALTFTRYGVSAFQLEYWTGSAWAPVPGGAVASNNKVWHTLTFSPLTTTKLRVVISGALAGYSRITELEAWGEPGAGGTTPPPPARVNHALSTNGATAAASSTLDANRAALAAINGDRRGQNWGSNPSAGSGWHDATTNNYPDWLEVTFNRAKTIDEVSVFSVQDNVSAPQEPTEALTFTRYGVSAFAVEYWTGSAWAAAPGASVTGNNLVWRKLTFAPITTTKLRVVVSGALNSYSRVAELEAWGPADSAAPARTNVASAANGATAAASSTMDANRAALAAINGDRRGQNWGSNPSAGSGWHDSTNNNYPDWLEVSFNGGKTISEVSVFSVQDNVTSPSEPTEAMTFTRYGVTDFAVEYWTGAGWAAVPGGAVAGNNLVWRKLTFAPVTTTKLRVIVTGGLAGYTRITEIEAY